MAIGIVLSDGSVLTIFGGEQFVECAVEIELNREYSRGLCKNAQQFFEENPAFATKCRLAYNKRTRA